MAMVYDLPTVDASAQPLQQFQAPESRNMAAEQAGQFGQALSSAGSVVTKIQQEFENDVAEAATRERINTLSSSVDEMISNPETGYLTKNGKAAVDSYKDVAKSIDDLTQKIGEDATTPLEKDMYLKLATKYKLDARQKIYTHALNQGKVWNVTEATKTMENIVDKMGQSFMYVGTPQFTDLTTKYSASLKDLARVSGIPEDSEAFKAADHDYKSKYNNQIIQNMIKTPGFTEKAKEYYYQNRSDIDDPKGDLLHQINSADDDLVGIKAADTAWLSVQGPGKDYNAPVKDNDLFEALKLDPSLDSKEKRAAAEQKMHSKINNWNKQQAEINQAGENTAWELLSSGQTLAQIKATPAWAQMSGEARGRFQLTFENIQAAKAARQASVAQRNYTQELLHDKILLRKNAVSYANDSDPARLSRMTRAEIIAKMPLYGQEGTDHLLAKWDTLQKRDEGLQVLGTEKVLKLNAQQAGIIPKTGKASDAQQDLYNRFELEVARRVKIFEQTKLEGRRKASEQELQSVVDGVLLDKAKVNGFWSDTEKPITLMTKDELAKSKVSVNGQDVYLTKIPAADRARYISILDSKEITPTEQRVAEMYVFERSKGKPSAAPSAPASQVRQPVTATRPAAAPAPGTKQGYTGAEAERIKAKEAKYQAENNPRAKAIAKAEKTGADEYVTATKADGSTVRTASKNATFNKNTLAWEVK